MNTFPIAKLTSYKDALNSIEIKKGSLKRFIIIDGQVVVANQKILKIKKSSLNAIDQKTKKIRLIWNTENVEIEVKVIRQSPCNPQLILIEREGIHFIKDNINSFQIKKPDNQLDDIEGITNNIISDGGTQDPPPTVGSTDGDYIPPSLLNETYIPLTEYWLKAAKEHNQTHLNAPVVAILDTGIDYRYAWTMRERSRPSWPLWFNESNIPTTCGTIEQDLIGWNFVGTGGLEPSTNANPYDDCKNKHGTRIAAIIAKTTNWNVRIMPLKTHNDKGVGEFFDIFCAFEYILRHPEVKFINASWGYYGRSINMFIDYLNKIKEKHIWFITAAGNQGDFENRIQRQLGETETMRFPAMFSATIENIITVTTVKNGLIIVPSVYKDQEAWVSTRENYSSMYVDLGIGAGVNGVFPESLQQGFGNIKGSSYATAYAVGLLVPFFNSSITTKDEFLNLISTQNDSAKQFIREGRIRNISTELIQNS